MRSCRPNLSLCIQNRIPSSFLLRPSAAPLGRVAGFHAGAAAVMGAHEGGGASAVAAASLPSASAGSLAAHDSGTGGRENPPLPWASEGWCWRRMSRFLNHGRDWSVGRCTSHTYTLEWNASYLSTAPPGMLGAHASFGGRGRGGRAHATPASHGLLVPCGTARRRHPHAAGSVLRGAACG
jgi:hypothetical protein